MIICNQCGSPLDENLRSCAECGTEKPKGFQPAPQSSASSVSRIGSPAVVNHTTPGSHRTGLSLVIVVLGGVVLLALGGIGTRALLSKSDEKGMNYAPPPVMTTNQAPVASPTVAQSQNLARAQPSLTAGVDNSSLKREVVETLQDWAAAASAHDLDAHMRYYADRLDSYFGRQGVSADYVRTDLARAYTRYNRISVQLNNIAVTIDPSGTTATAIFDKKYDFAGDKTLSGAVQQMLRLDRSTGLWRITGQKDLRVYYTNK